MFVSCFSPCRSCWHQLPEKRPPASEILRQMEEPAFLCHCRLAPETNEGLLEKVTAVHVYHILGLVMPLFNSYYRLSRNAPENTGLPLALLLTYSFTQSYCFV